MTSLSTKYRRLIRLREKRARIQRLITILEQSLKGAKATWGGCSGSKNRR